MFEDFPPCKRFDILQLCPAILTTTVFAIFTKKKLIRYHLLTFDEHVLAYGKIRVSPRIERARVICQRPRKNFGKERAFGARARHR